MANYYLASCAHDTPETCHSRHQSMCIALLVAVAFATVVFTESASRSPRDRPHAPLVVRISLRTSTDAIPHCARREVATFAKVQTHPLSLMARLVTEWCAPRHLPQCARSTCRLLVTAATIAP